VRTTRLATELGQSTWATWYYLTRLEARGLIYRPSGKKSGWLAA
jgi:Mn-dependent DtxR family transcriptional regulator